MFVMRESRDLRMMRRIIVPEDQRPVRTLMLSSG